MDYYAGLGVSLEKTHICVLDRDGTVVLEATASSSPAAIAMALGEAPACTRVVFETGRTAPMLYHELAELGMPVVCVESRHRRRHGPP
jgi:transposase